jgi:ubiquinone/menaquinone biosynthesis C-methylase UbiE
MTIETWKSLHHDSSEAIRAIYRERATLDRYATSPDYNLRELEIEAISRHLSSNQTVLDVGCGNGYSTLSFASQFSSSFTGVDFVPEMVAVSQQLSERAELRGSACFEIGDATNLRFEDERFDVVVSQRCLLNLPSREDQWRALAEIARVLKPGGRYLMLEGTIQGLAKLNELRRKFALDPIPEADPQTNRYSLKFDETEVERQISGLFARIESIERFGMYFFLSRVIHPLLVRPEQPRYDAPINSVARTISSQLPEFDGLGHVALWSVLR